MRAANVPLADWGGGSARSTDMIIYIKAEQSLEKIRIQVRVTGKGLSKLASLLNQPMLLDENEDEE